MSKWRRRTYRVVRYAFPGIVRDMLELCVQSNSALVKAGWPQSRRMRLPVGSALQPLPWYTYPAIRFLEPRVPQSARVFEYGMGNSTRWWSERAASVECCEHDEAWFKRISSSLPPNVSSYLHPTRSDAYIHAAAHAAAEIDILVIDGRRRVSCARNSLGRLSASGVVVWDNSDRSYYAPGYVHLIENGFAGRLDFWGMGPINVVEWCTSVFYKRDNCLGI